jgi:type IV pilus assembly protein PilV
VPMTILSSNKAGFTLVELLVSLVIMLVGVVGLLHAVNIALQTNSQNQMRNEAAQIGDLAMNELRIKPFALISTTYIDKLVASRQKNIAKNFTVSRSGILFGAYSASRELVVQVRWNYRNNPQALELRTVRSK